jgi:uncharacterized protein YacL
MNGWPLKLLLLVVCAAGGFLMTAGMTGDLALGIPGLVGGLLIWAVSLVLESQIKKVESRNLAGGVIGLIVGLIVAHLILLSLGGELVDGRTRAYILFFTSVALGYIGLVVGSQKGLSYSLGQRPEAAPSAKEEESFKILDTSVIIDGRIADIVETGFLEGTFIIPQFVLRELQHIADSSDTLKRNRGRRGLDILHRIQKKIDLDVKIVEHDFPRIREVDAKLIALGKKMGGKIITNDFNLNKIAELQGVTVLNINQLANALKPVVLPGELMKVYILKEGKEHNQGVAYLDDGTMVVVDNAKRVIGKNVEVLVTSVLQTTAGRMIFTQLKEEASKNNHYTQERTVS